jgi:hypothetical protein
MKEAYVRYPKPCDAAAELRYAHPGVVGQLDPDLVLVPKYLNFDLLPDEWDCMDARLAADDDDDDLHEKAWPLIRAFQDASGSGPSATPRDVDEARVRRALERFCRSIGRTPDSGKADRTADGKPILPPET